MKRLTKAAGGLGLLAGIITAGAAIFGALADRRDCNEEIDAQAAENNSRKEETQNVNITCEGLTTEPITYVDAAPTEEQ